MLPGIGDDEGPLPVESDEESEKSLPALHRDES